MSLFPYLTALLLQNAPAQGSPPPSGGAASPSGGGSMGMPDMLFLVLMFVGIMYFVVIRPASRERKKQSQMMAALKKGDRVLLTCGLLASVERLTEREVVVKVDDKNPLRMRFQKQSIQTIIAADEPAAAEVAEAEAK
jgi:preprotein translocase subunit YajC